MPKINAPETRTLNHLGGVLEAEATNRLSDGKAATGSGTLTGEDSSCSQSVVSN